jgi:hypothetical protein
MSSYVVGQFLHTRHLDKHPLGGGDLKFIKIFKITQVFWDMMLIGP